MSATKTPKQVAKFLRRYNAWRRGSETIEHPNPTEIGEVIDAAIAIIERDHFRDAAQMVGRHALQAKVAEQSAEIGRLTKERDEYNSAWQRSGVEYRKLRDSLLSLAGEFK